MGRVDGKIVVVTGAASGQGEAEARLLAREGAIVFATDVHDTTDVFEGAAGPIDGGLSSHGGTKSMSDAVRANERNPR